MTAGRSFSAAAKLSSRVSNKRKFRPNGLLVSRRIAPARSSICSRREIVAAERAEPAGLRHRGDQLRRGGRAHAAERDRMLDVQQIADRRADHAFLPETCAARFARVYLLHGHPARRESGGPGIQSYTKSLHLALDSGLAPSARRGMTLGVALPGRPIRPPKSSARPSFSPSSWGRTWSASARPCPRSPAPSSRRCPARIWWCSMSSVRSQRCWPMVMAMK